MKTLFLTHRADVHNQRLIAAAPPELGLEFTLLRDASKAQILERIAEAEFLITEREDEIDAEILAAARRLRLIQRLGSHTYDIDLAAAQAAGIAVCCWPEASTLAVAEHCLMQSLALLKKSREMEAVMRAARWERPPRRSDEDTFAYNWSGRSGVGQLWGKTAGILGFGEIGRCLAGMLRGFNVETLYHKRRPLPARGEQELGVRYAGREELLGRAEVLYCLLPFDPQAAQSLDAEFFAALRPGAIFIFCGGSGMVDEQALLAALCSGHLAGAALDTYTWEPLPADGALLRAWREETAPGGQAPLNLLLTPHVAAGTGNFDRQGEFSNLQRLLRGEALQYRVA